MPKAFLRAPEASTSRALPEVKLKSWELPSTQLVIGPYYRYFMSAKPFRATEACIGCGSCAAVCPQQIDIPGVLADFAELMA
jgi:ferredoxin